MAVGTKFMVSLFKTPQAQDDSSSGLEDALSFINISDLLANDLGGDAKTFYGLYDAADPTAASQTISSSLGAQLTIEPDGTISYDATGADTSKIQMLSNGETIQDSFEYIIRLADGTLSKAIVWVTVTGQNDSATYSVDDAGSVFETDGTPASGAVLADSGIITFTDTDLRDVHSATLAASQASGLLGTLTLMKNADSTDTTPLDLIDPTAPSAVGQFTWAYQVDAARVEYLSLDEPKQETFVIELSDGWETVQRTITITIIQPTYRSAAGADRRFPQYHPGSGASAGIA